MKKQMILPLVLTLLVCSTQAQDAGSVEKIKEQGLQRSQVMNYAFRLTDVSGPRLTNSPGYFRAANWAKEELTRLGLTNAALEPWGDFGKGWELKKSYIAMTAPYYRPLIGFPKTWTKGTNGLKSADVILVKAADSAALEAYKGKLKNKIVLLYRNDTLKPTYKPDAERFTQEELNKMADAQPDTARRRGGTRTLIGSLPMSARVRRLAESEGSLAVLTMSPRGFHGTLFVQGGGPYGASDPENFPDMMIAFEDYMSLVRLADAGIPVKLDIETEVTFQTKDTKGYNVVAEIKGTDPLLKDEVVMLGGHLDSWQGSTGATDNAAGCAVMIEAVRIIQQSGLKPKRTIRIALWGGEEQGLHGSRNYVKNHFADPATMELKPEHSKISAYYNIDNGTGKVRGIYLQGNEAVKDIFTQWLKPFHDMGATTVTISNTGGTDHQAFDAVGIPGFQFIQDEIEYNTRTHHTNMDSYDHLQAEDLKQIATIVASFVYNSANLDQKLPRKALPAARGN